TAIYSLSLHDALPIYRRGTTTTSGPHLRRIDVNHPPTARQHRRGHRGLAALAATALVAVELVATVAPATAAPHDDVDYTSFVDRSEEHTSNSSHVKIS